MEVVKQEGNQVQRKIYCEKHRPFHLIKELDAEVKKSIEQVITFSKLIERGKELVEKYSSKKRSQPEKKWREKDKKALLERVRERFFNLRKQAIIVVKQYPGGRRKRRRVSSPI